MASAYRDAASPLGALVRVHKGRSDGCFAVVAGSLLVLACVTLGAVSFLTGSWLQGALSVVLAVAGVWYGRRWLAGLGPDLIEVHEEGLLQRQRGKSVEMRFEDVASIRSVRVKGRYGARAERHEIHAADGRCITFSLMHDLALDLLADIEAQVVPRLQKQALRAFDAGEIVRFGTVALSEHGVHLPARVLPWSELREVTVEKGSIGFVGEARRRLGGVAARDVSNVTIFLMMAELAIEQEQAGQQDGVEGEP